MNGTSRGCAPAACIFFSVRPPVRPVFLRFHFQRFSVPSLSRFAPSFLPYCAVVEAVREAETTVDGGRGERESRTRGFGSDLEVNGLSRRRKPMKATSEAEEEDTETKRKKKKKERKKEKAH